MAVNVVEIAPAGTVTEVADTSSSALLLDSDTNIPASGAALLRVTVHVVADPELKLLGLQASEDSTAGAIRLTFAVWDTPLRVAVSVAV